MQKDNLHNKTFLNHISDKETGLTVPKNYFNSIEDSIFSTLTTAKFPKNKGFIVPDGYFDSLENTIVGKVTTPKKIIPLKTRILQLVPIVAAASIVLFIVINYYSLNHKNFTFENISSDDVAYWLEEGYENLNTNDIAMAMEISDMNELDEENNMLSNTSIEQYIDYNIDTYTLINELN